MLGGWTHPSRRMVRGARPRHDVIDRECHRTYSDPGNWFVTVSVAWGGAAFGVFRESLLEALGLA